MVREFGNPREPEECGLRAGEEGREGTLTRDSMLILMFRYIPALCMASHSAGTLRPTTSRYLRRREASTSMASTCDTPWRAYIAFLSSSAVGCSFEVGEARTGERRGQHATPTAAPSPPQTPPPTRSRCAAAAVRSNAAGSIRSPNQRGTSVCAPALQHTEVGNARKRAQFGGSLGGQLFRWSYGFAICSFETLISVMGCRYSIDLHPITLIKMLNEHVATLLQGQRNDWHSSAPHQIMHVSGVSELVLNS